MVYILSGVSGVGKTTIGLLLSARLDLPFYDADDFHPEENVEMMAAGMPLQDKDRHSWLQTLAKNIINWNKAGGAVLACSALKESYRRQLQSIPKEELQWIFLHSEYEVILERVSGRSGHYFKSSLLQSQYETLERPEYGLHINVNKPEENIIEEIMQNINATPAEIGLFGLGVMGKSLAINLATKGIHVSVFNRHVEGVEVDIAKDFAKENAGVYNFPWFDDLKAFVDSLATPRNILLMVNAGKTVDLVIESLLPFLEKGDLIIDGGNSYYADSLRREKELEKNGILFLGAGISGGEEGAKNGPSIMPGGSKEAYDRAGKYLEKISARDKKGNPCCAYIGPEGSGHFVKMLHNGIEYGEMQLIAEFYHNFRYSYNFSPAKISSIFTDWNKEIQSYLLEISADILLKKEGEDFLIDKILDAAKQKGTGGWSTNAALELGVPFDTITAAVMARNISALKQERRKAGELYEDPSAEKISHSQNFSDLFSAYKSASTINHAIGFSLLTAASREFKWDLKLSEISRIWTNGCIIKSAFMEDLITIFKDIPDENLLVHPNIVQQLKDYKSSHRLVAREALQSGIPMPVLMAAQNYFLGYTAAQSSANMIQAQRDYFGAHTYERTDKPRGEFFHTNWKPEA
jgi:6-phosphogluconate dehydrogenase